MVTYRNWEDLLLRADVCANTYTLTNGMDVAGEIAMGLLGVLGTTLAFLGFFCALYFSRDWSRFTKRALKVVIVAMGISSTIIGVCCAYAVVESSTLNSIILGSVGISHLLILVIGCMISAALIVTALTLIRG
ncbi:hypothetical protein KAU55_00440 [Candidatus Bathyarchaeota archaeon]|nr:hypothetical protein [Candidatus Bathyarchaeota archaeon]